MQLLKLEVRNWVHHRFRVCEFTRGLVAILGENGSGKSSLFGAIRWALTGENPNYGVKTDNISQYAKEGEPAYVTLEFEHNGHIAVVSRHLLPEKEQSVLTVDGVEAGRGDKSVTAGVEKLLGVDSKFISRFIIVGQTDIFSFIDDNQTDTDKFFQRLFNTAKADKCQDVLGKNLNKITIPEILKTSAQLTSEKEILDGAIAELLTQFDGLPTFDDFLRAQRVDQAMINEWEKREKSGQELVKLTQQEKEYEKQLEAVVSNSKQHVEDFTALVDITSGHDAAHAAARSALGHWQSYKSVAKAKTELQASHEAISAKRLSNPQPPAIEASVIAGTHGQLANLKKQLNEMQSFVEVFVVMGNAHCPTCHTPTTDLAQHLNKTQEVDIPATTEMIEAAEKLLIAQQAIDSAYRAWDKLDRELTAREQQLTEAEEKLVAVPPPANSEDELTQTVNEYAEFQRVKAELEPLVRQAAEKRATLAGILSGLRDRKAQLYDEIAAISATAADAHMANARLTKLRNQYAARQELERQKTQLDFDAQRLEEQRVLAEQQERQAIRLRKWTAVAEQAREALKNAPRLVAQRNLLKLESAINELLQIFAVNFIVRAPADGSPTFIAEFFDGRRQVAQRLSIGQKTVLALAFRVAVNAMFAEEIGLLALDEPTASLDAARIHALAPVLERLRDLSTAKGLQCLLVTHASNLSHLFESVIELEAPELRHVQQSR